MNDAYASIVYRYEYAEASPYYLVANEEVLRNYSLRALRNVTEELLLLFAQLFWREAARQSGALHPRGQVWLDIAVAVTR